MNKKKPKHDVIPPEKIELGVKYAFSYNMATIASLNLEKFKNEVGSYVRILYDILSPNSVDYSFYLECSSTGKLHLHGYISFLDIARAYLFTIPYLCAQGTLSIKEIDEEDEGANWFLYCTKGKHYMQQICEFYKIPYRITKMDVLAKGTWLERYRNLCTMKQRFIANSLSDDESDVVPLPDEFGPGGAFTE